MTYTTYLLKISEREELNHLQWCQEHEASKQTPAHYRTQLIMCMCNSSREEKDNSEVGAALVAPPPKPPVLQQPGKRLTLGQFAWLYNVITGICFTSYILFQESVSFQMQISCWVHIRFPLLLLTLLLCISIRSDCIVMLPGLQNTHFHLRLSICG